VIRRLRALVRKIEGDPATQYKMHRFAMRFWLFNAIAVLIVFFAAPATWTKVSVLYLVLVSLYANVATDFGAMSAAEAAADGAVSEYTQDAAADEPERERTDEVITVCEAGQEERA